MNKYNRIHEIHLIQKLEFNIKISNFLVNFLKLYGIQKKSCSSKQCKVEKPQTNFPQYWSIMDVHHDIIEPDVFWDVGALYSSSRLTLISVVLSFSFCLSICICPSTCRRCCCCYRVMTIKSRYRTVWFQCVLKIYVGIVVPLHSC